MKALPIVLVLLSLGLLPLRSEPSTADSLLDASREALAAGEAARAVELAEQAVSAAPERADLQAHLGTAYSVRMGQVGFMQQAMLAGKMRGAFEKAIALDPDHLPGRIGLARYFTHAPSIAGGSRAKAEAEAEEIARRDAFLGAMELGHIAARFEDREHAIAHYQRAAELKPSHAWVHRRLGELLEALQRGAEARVYYQRALDLDAEQPAVREALARLDEKK